MKHAVTLVAALLLAPLAALSATSDLHGPIRIESGLIEGLANEEGDIVAFKGIPYAAPPVGELRWREPQPVAKWEDVRKADVFGASCPQPASTFAPPYTAEFAVTNATSEDCLFLNVWTPAKSAAEKLGVLVYIHGGSGIRGSGAVSVYDGEALAKKGIIVVTINFRLGIFGGMGHPQLTAESPHHVCGNYGMLDMIAALKWVHENVAAFGGDPQKVTLAGQSSGCMALHYLLTSPLTKGMVRGAIAVSFSYDYLTKPHAIGNVWQKEQQGLKFAAAKKVAGIAELRKMPPTELMAYDPSVEPFTRACLNGSPNTDGWSFLMEYPKALAEGALADVPMLTGITADDFGPPPKYLKTTVASFATELPKMFGEKREAFLAKQSDYLALCRVSTDDEARAMLKRAQQEYRMASIFHWANWRAKTARMPVFTYVFDQAIPWPEHPEFGAFHSSDLVYAFNNLAKMNHPWTDDDRRVGELVSAYWVNFVKTGNPNGDGLPEWKPFVSVTPATMTIGAKPGARELAEKERLGFYRELLEK